MRDQPQRCSHLRNNLPDDHNRAGSGESPSGQRPKELRAAKTIQENRNHSIHQRVAQQQRAQK